MSKSLILPRSTKEQPVGMVTADNEHLYEQPHPIHPVFKVVMLGIYHLCPQLRRMNMQMDGSIPNTPENTRRDIGVFEASFDHWTCVLNWTEEKRLNLPPDYIGVDFGDSSAGILGPWADIRTCWHCGLTGYRDPQRQLPCVVPGQSCPNCGQRDWWAKLVTMDDLVEAASTRLAREVNRELLWRELGGRDVELRKQGVPAGAW